MSVTEFKDAERVDFIAPVGSKDLYRRIAKLEGLSFNAWIRITLHQEATRVLKKHGHDIADMPPVHLERPPRLQPRLEPERDPEADSE